MNSQNTFTVLIPTWKRELKLTTCLEHLLVQKICPDQVLVVVRPEDSGSQAIIHSFQEKMPYLKKVFVHDIGVVAAENAGLKVIDTTHVCFLDDDGYAPIDWMEKIKIFFENYPNALALGGGDLIKLEPESYHDFPQNIVGKLTFYGKVIGNHHRKIIGGMRKVDVLKGVNMTFKRSSFDFLDERLTGKEGHLGNGSQWELDLCMRVKSISDEIYFDPSLMVVHDSNHSHHNFIESAKNNTHNLTYVILKNSSLVNKISFLIYAIFVGNTQLPGVTKFLFDLRKFNDVFFNSRLYYQKWLGFIFGIKTYVRSISL